MYEHSAGIPLIVWWPRRWGGEQRRRGACSLVDLVQTITELAGAEAPEDWDGDSMLPWLDGTDRSWKDLALSEYYGHNIASGFTMLRQGKYKYVYHARFDEEHGPEQELYDLEVDPEEFCNLANEPAYTNVTASMHERLVRELGEDPDDIEQRCRDDYSRGYSRNPEEH